MSCPLTLEVESILESDGLIVLFVGPPCVLVGIYDASDGVVADAGVLGNIPNREVVNGVLVDDVDPLGVRDLPVDRVPAGVTVVHLIL